jgi:hypothetical protein
MKKNLYKIIFDTVMLFIIPFLYFVNITGNLVHEILGLILIAFVVVHLGYNYKWISKMRNFKLTTNIINIALLISFAIIAITGIRASHSLFTFSEKADDIFIKLHLIFGMVSIVLVGIHIFLHWKLIKVIFTKQIILDDKIAKSVFIVFLIFSLVFVSFATYEIVPKILSDKNQNTENGDIQNHGPKDGEKK